MIKTKHFMVGIGVVLLLVSGVSSVLLNSGTDSVSSLTFSMPRDTYPVVSQQDSSIREERRSEFIASVRSALMDNPPEPVDVFIAEETEEESIEATYSKDDTQVFEGYGDVSVGTSSETFPMIEIPSSITTPTSSTIPIMDTSAQP